MEFEESVKNFNSKFKNTTSGDDELEEKFMEAVNECLVNCEEFQMHKSGWSLLKNCFVLLSVVTPKNLGSKPIKYSEEYGR